jgi:hypothetical protein
MEKSPTSEEDKLIKKLASEMTDQICGVLSFTETPRLDYVINQALAGDTWYSKPDNSDNIADEWFKGLIMISVTFKLVLPREISLKRLINW